MNNSNKFNKCMKVGILWGGGLGDLLMIRPFLKALHADANIDSYLLTSASHASHLFEEFCSPTKVVLFNRDHLRILSDIKKWRCYFDLIYLGPYPTFKTRLLGNLLSPRNSGVDITAMCLPLFSNKSLQTSEQSVWLILMSTEIFSRFCPGKYQILSALFQEGNDISFYTQALRIDGPQRAGRLKNGLY